LSQLAYYIRKRDRVSVGWVEQSETQHFREEGSETQQDFRLSRLGWTKWNPTL